MNVFRKIGIAATLSAAAATGLPVFAQAIPPLVYKVILPATGFGSTNYTEVLTSSIAAAQQFCADLNNDSYTVDCLAERLGNISDDIPPGTDYQEVKQILQDTSDQLENLARQNRDPNQARGRATRAATDTTPELTTTRPLTPVTPQSLPQVNQQAAAILDNTETLLLRSAAGAESKAQQYSRIAEALNSSKVLLRSS
jgi:ABC-type transporter Mla subunit MlaD